MDGHNTAIRFPLLPQGSPRTSFLFYGSLIRKWLHDAVFGASNPSELVSVGIEVFHAEWRLTKGLWSFKPPVCCF